MHRLLLCGSNLSRHQGASVQHCLLKPTQDFAAIVIAEIVEAAGLAIDPKKKYTQKTICHQD